MASAHDAIKPRRGVFIDFLCVVHARQLVPQPVEKEIHAKRDDQREHHVLPSAGYSATGSTRAMLRVSEFGHSRRLVDRVESARLLPLMAQEASVVYSEEAESPRGVG